MSLSGLPALTRDDAAISFDWGQGAPANGLPADGFSVRWTRLLKFDAGTYRFSVRSDDGIRLWLDGGLQIDEWHNASGQTYAREVQLGAGNHNLRLEYFENGGGALIYFTMQRVEDYDKWKGEYFPNDHWAGSPVIVQNDDRLDFNWGTGSPDQLLPSDRFSVRWTRSIVLEPGTYRFDLNVDDGVRFWIDNVLVLDKLQPTSGGMYSIVAMLTPGTHAFRLDYVEYTGNARFSWTRTFLGGPTATPTVTRTVDLYQDAHRNVNTDSYRHTDVHSAADGNLHAHGDTDGNISAYCNTHRDTDTRRTMKSTSRRLAHSASLRGAPQSLREVVSNLLIVL
jgi:hypothetical protein